MRASTIARLAVPCACAAAFALGSLAEAIAATPSDSLSNARSGRREAVSFSLADLEQRIPPEPLSPWSAVEEEIERLVARGELPFEARDFRPVDRGELAAWLEASASGSAEAARGVSESHARTILREMLRWDSAWLSAMQATAWPHRPGSILLARANDRLLLVTPYARAMPRFQTGEEPAWTDSSRFGIRAAFFAGRSLVVQGSMFAAEIERGRTFADPLVENTDFILHADELTLSARLGALRLRLGRDRHQWGMGASGTLLLAESAQPFDFAEYQIRLGERLRFLALTGITDRHASLAGANTNPGANRYLSAHRLQWTITPDLALALAEGARYQADQPGLLYLAGFVPYTLVERLEMQDEPSDSTENFLRNNVLWSADLSWRARPGLLIYGSILADDIATQSASMPTRMGGQVGFSYAPQWRGWDWTLAGEYARISDFTYSVYYQDVCRCDWEHQGRALGYARGPDVEALLLRASVAPSVSWNFGSSVLHTRKGNGAIGRPWLPESTGCDPVTNEACGEVNAWSLDDARSSWRVQGEARFRYGPLLWAGVQAAWTWRKDAVSVNRESGYLEEKEADWESDTTLRCMISAGG